MYIVVSRWRAHPSKEAEFEQIGHTMRKILSAQPGVHMVQGIRTESGDVLAIHSYDDQTAYQRVIHDPESPFNKAALENNLEGIAEWIS